MMQVSKSNNKPINFGWNKKTHLEMTKLALKDSKLDEVTKNRLARYSQMPDFDCMELGEHCNTHFYFPNSKKKSFGKNSDKFNAFNQFKEHVTTALLSRDNDNFIKHAGYALHYLQDMAVPFHTERGGLVSKVLKYKLHSDFEKGAKYGAQSNIKKLMENYNSKTINFTTFLDLFKNTAEFSQKPHLRISRYNKEKWYSIQQECFDMGVNTTREFFEKLLSLKNNRL